MVACNKSISLQANTPYQIQIQHYFWFMTQKMGNNYITSFMKDEEKINGKTKTKHLRSCKSLRMNI